MFCFRSLGWLVSSVAVTYFHYTAQLLFFDFEIVVLTFALAPGPLLIDKQPPISNDDGLVVLFLRQALRRLFHMFMVSNTYDVSDSSTFNSAASSTD